MESYLMAHFKELLLEDDAPPTSAIPEFAITTNLIEMGFPQRS
ncbi:hypothetical protein LINPERPRIM_LOCUS32435 [Linum perenne]